MGVGTGQMQKRKMSSSSRVFPKLTALRHAKGNVSQILSVRSILGKTQIRKMIKLTYLNEFFYWHIRIPNAPEF